MRAPYPLNIQKYIYLIGKNYKFAKELYKKNNNPYLYLGLKEMNKIIAKRNDLEILKALNNVYVEKIFNSFLCQKRNYEKDRVICNIILKWKLFNQLDKKNKLLEIISYHNDVNQFIEIDSLSEEFLDCLSGDECDILLENFRYTIEKKHSFIGTDFMELFEKFPQNTRKFIKKCVDDNIKLDSSIDLYITSANNYKEERKNNVLLILELLKEKEYFQIWQYASQLIEKKDKCLINDLLEIVTNDSSEEILKAISKLLLELDIDIKEVWKIIKVILLKTNDEETKNNVEYVLIKIKSANSFYEAYKKRKTELNKIKKKEKNEILKEILNHAALHCTKMYDIEKLRELKRNEERDFSFSKSF